MLGCLGLVGGLVARVLRLRSCGAFGGCPLRPFAFLRLAYPVPLVFVQILGSYPVLSSDYPLRLLLPGGSRVLGCPM